MMACRYTGTAHGRVYRTMNSHLPTCYSRSLFTPVAPTQTHGLLWSWMFTKRRSICIEYLLNHGTADSRDPRPVAPSHTLKVSSET